MIKEKIYADVSYNLFIKNKYAARYNFLIFLLYFKYLFCKMRIDLFLWYSRIYKSRTIASNSCKKGHVKLNDKSIKPSFECIYGSVFTVKKNQILNKYEILDFPHQELVQKF